ncbi:MAG: outer membrane beta-barrel protein [Gammaproteobacteria bacterium]
MRKWNYLSLAFMLAALVLSAPANAGGPYGDVALGVGAYGNSKNDAADLQSQLSQEGILSNVTVEDGTIGATLGLGYRFDRYVALEVDYVDLGTATATVDVYSPSVATFKQDNQATGETLDLIGFIPLTQRISLFGKVGAFSYTLKETLHSSIPLLVGNLSYSATTTEFGSGVEIDFTPRLGLRSGISVYSEVGDKDTTGRTNIGFAYAQLVVSF